MAHYKNLHMKTPTELRHARCSQTDRHVYLYTHILAVIDVCVGVALSQNIVAIFGAFVIPM